jgi:hypothetical protein
VNDDDKRLFVESIAAMRELKAELHEFKEHSLERIKRLEGNEARRHQLIVSTLSVVIAAGALIVALIKTVNG